MLLIRQYKVLIFNPPITIRLLRATVLLVAIRKGSADLRMIFAEALGLREKLSFILCARVLLSPISLTL